MMVHSVIALAPITAISYIFYKLQVTFYTFDQPTWRFLTIISFAVMFLITLPAVLSGIFERGHMYAKWHSTHKIKLVLSDLLIVAFLIELGLLIQYGLGGMLFSLLGVLMIFGNNILAFLLGGYGLKISLGRQSFEKLSYTPDLSQKDPVDILAIAGERKYEEAKYLDLLTER